MNSVNTLGVGINLESSKVKSQNRRSRQSLFTRVMKGARFIAVSALALFPTVSASLRGRGLATDDSVRQDLALINSYISQMGCSGFDSVTEQLCDEIDEFDNYKTAIFCRKTLSSNQQAELDRILDRVRGSFVALISQKATV
ncbi:hypothetical protein DID75_04340 [Candidatus Marinamargulisbacteria bacterium SCGC AG-410-N11]|nr:hypothetical protein DID75_04340 [Candidatus Marinamargulisbacteria bacterium SCGC AG-410-N11]